MRHAAASLRIAVGVDIKTVSAWLGHSTAKLTLDACGRLMGTDADRAALDQVNRGLGSFTGPAEASGPVAGECKRPNGLSTAETRWCRRQDSNLRHPV